jgi:hypothetical protein
VINSGLDHSVPFHIALTGRSVLPIGKANDTHDFVNFFGDTFDDDWWAVIEGLFERFR